MPRIYSVTQVNSYVRNMLGSDPFLRKISVKGEVSNCKYHSSGHIYFTIKDEGAAVSCTMFADAVDAGLDFRLENGQSIVIEGSASLFVRDGKFQFYVKKITLDGRGDLYVRYEALKQKLYEEGLFDFEHKKEIPVYCKNVGIVTAATGAAIQDIKNIAKRRNPYVQLYLYPAKVQGEGAAQTIVEGIRRLDRMGLDCIIVGRGGGSIEDLWAFNEEITARAIYEAKTPIISGVGHEIDTTISDYAADLRAPTPSAACELAVFDVMSSLRGIEEKHNQLKLLMWKKLDSYKKQYQILLHGIAVMKPQDRLYANMQLRDQLEDQLLRAMQDKLQNAKYALAIYTERLNGLSPTAKLINGYGYISLPSGSPVKSIKDVNPSDGINVTLSDGIIMARVENVKER